MEYYEAMMAGLETFRTILNVFMVLMLLYGLLQCFLGYRIFRVVTAITGFLIGAVLGMALGFWIAQSVPVVLLCALLVGALGAFLAYKFYMVGVFLICFMDGGIIGAAIALLTHADLDMYPVFFVVLGFVFGVAGVIVKKPMLIIVTAIGGGLTVGITLVMLTGLPILMLAGIAAAAGGIFVQLKVEMPDLFKSRVQPGTNIPPAPDGTPPGPPPMPGSAAPAPEQKPEGPAAETVPAALESGAEAPPAPAAQESGAPVQPAPAVAPAAGEKPAASAAAAASSLLGKLKSSAGPAQKQAPAALTTTKTPRRPERAGVLTSSPSPLWQKGSPVVLTECSIVSGGENAAGLDLGIQNLSDRPVIGAFFTVRCQDLLKQDLPGMDRLAVQDMVIEPGRIWFTPVPFTLPDGTARRVSVSLRNVVFADDTVWNAERDEPLVPVDPQPVIGLPPELRGEFWREVRPLLPGQAPERIFQYAPQRRDGFWFCSCGQMNTGDRCTACGMEQDALFRLFNPEQLEKDREARMAEEQRTAAEKEAERKRLEEERRQKIKEQTDAARQKAAEAGAAAAAAGKKAAETAGNLGRQTLEQAKAGAGKAGESLKTAGTSVSTRMKTFRDEKLLPNRRPLTAALIAFLAVALVGSGISVAVVSHQKAAEEARLAAIQAQEEEEAARLQAEEEARQKTEEEVQLRLEEEQKRAEEETRLAAEEAAAWEAQFIFPDSDSRLLTEQDLKGMDESRLALARDEITARHGRSFEDGASAQWFASVSWYIPSSSYSDDLLTDTEKSNIALIDSRIEKLHSVSYAKAYLDLLNSFSEPFSGYSSLEMVPANGIYFWMEMGYDSRGALPYMYWNSASGPQQRAVSPGLLSARLSDMDRDGMPELITITASDVNDNYCVDVWTLKDGKPVKAADTVNLFLLVPSGWLYTGTVTYLNGADRDYIAVRAEGGDEEGLVYTYDQYLSPDHSLSLYEESTPDPENFDSRQTIWQVNDVNTDRETYVNTPVPQGAETQWSKSLDNEPRFALQQIQSSFPDFGLLPASFSLNGPQEIRDTRAELEALYDID